MEVGSSNTIRRVLEEVGREVVGRDVVGGGDGGNVTPAGNGDKVVGTIVGLDEGETLGLVLGISDGDDVGDDDIVGEALGQINGVGFGEVVGLYDGEVDGKAVGLADGDCVKGESSRDKPNR